MIIFGTRGVTYNYGTGDFNCPTCTTESAYKHKRVRRFFTLYFIPVIPLDLLGEYVECRDCASTYDPGVLEYDPGAGRDEFEAAFHTAIRKVMLLMVLADGVVDDEEIEVVCDIYGRLAERELTPEQVREECAELAGESIGVEEYVAGIRGSLNDAGKELVIKAALAVAGADGEVADEELQLLMAIGEAMEMSRAHIRGLLIPDDA